MQALGTIEVVGLVAGIEAADVACKAANVTLIGYELAKGGGYVTVKVEGQVGAVTAAIDAAEAAAAKLTRVVSRLVIPRPAAGLDALVFSPATVGYTPPEPAATAPEPAENAPKAAPKTAPANKLLPAADSGAKSGASPGRKEPAKPEATQPKPSQRPARAKRASAARNEPAPGPGEPAQQPQGTPPQAPQQAPKETNPAPQKNQQEE